MHGGIKQQLSITDYESLPLEMNMISEESNLKWPKDYEGGKKNIV